MAYIRVGGDGSALGFFGCGPGCRCASCRVGGAGLAEWYVREEEEEEPSQPAQVGGFALVPLNPNALGERLFTIVSALPGDKIQRYLEFARRLSFIPRLTSQQKADLLQTFAPRFDLDVGGQAPMPGGRILLVAKDGRTAFQIAADGTITFGRFNQQTLDVVNPVPIRPLTR